MGKHFKPEEFIMPRTQRLIINDESTVYHVMSRTALDGFPLGDIEKDLKKSARYKKKENGFGWRRASISNSNVPTMRP